MSNKKYELAVITALGEKRGCGGCGRSIREGVYSVLEEQRVPADEFVPLKDIKAMSENNERLRAG